MNSDRLEQNAIQERGHVEGEVRELIDKVSQASPRYQFERHFSSVAMVGFIVTFLLGYAIASIPSGR